MIVLNEIIQIFFPEWTYGEYLDMHARAAGLSRKSATAASGKLKVTGVEGTLIPKGFVFSTPATAVTSNVEYATLEDAVIPGDSEERTVYIDIQCTENGHVGNVPANSVTLMASPIGGIADITNEDAITGGTDDETDEDLRQRIMEHDKSNESSFVGNDADYKRWAKEIDGVGSVAVVPEWEGAGTGTVKLIIMDANGDPANEKTLKDVYNHIMSPENRDKRLAPIGAILTVVTADSVDLTITAQITLEDDADIDSVTAAFKVGLSAYFDEAKQEGCVRYTRVGSVLSGTAGVADYKELYINGTRNNVAIDVDDYPALKSVEFTKAV